MNNQTPEAPLLDPEAFRAPRARVWIVLLGVAWLLLLAGDWFMRVYWFRWHEQVYSRPVVTADRPMAAPPKEFTTLEWPAGRGGDLTRLLGVPAARAPYEDARPATTLTIDPEGFRSLPYEPGQSFEVVVVGDSYMTDGLPLTNLFSSRLSARLGRPVQNRAFMGRGPFQSLMLWIENNWGRPPYPKWIVWGFVERDISGHAFAGYVYLIERHRGRVEVAEKSAVNPRARVIWRSLAPASLRKAWPNTSALAQLSRRAWAHLQYRVFRELPADVFHMADPAGMQPPMLGYRLAMDSIYWPPAVRNLDQVVESIAYIQDYLNEIGVRLLVMPIPDKEQVYREWIPASQWRGGQPPPASIIPNLVQRLNARGIAAVSLLDPFREAQRAGVPLYWRDDTHWRPEGIALAAELIAAPLGGTFVQDEK